MNIADKKVIKPVLLFMGYYCQFIKTILDWLAPLIHLTVKDVKNVNIYHA